MKGVRIACPNCSGVGDIARDYAARMSDGGTGTGTVVSSCRSCGGSGWISHPGTWKPPTARKK